MIAPRPGRGCRSGRRGGRPGLGGPWGGCPGCDALRGAAGPCSPGCRGLSSGRPLRGEWDAGQWLAEDGDRDL